MTRILPNLINSKQESQIMNMPQRDYYKDSRTVCALPPVGLFAKDPKTIAESLASKEISPGGPASGMRVLSFYISHASKSLSASKRRNLEKAKKLLSAHLNQSLKEELRKKIA
jgi:tRNA(adenine34) deaminase